LGVFLATLVNLMLGSIALRRFGLAFRIWPAQPFLVSIFFAAALAIGLRLILSRLAAIETSRFEDSVWHVRHPAHARRFARPKRERLSRIRARRVATAAFFLLRRSVAYQPSTLWLQCAGLRLLMSQPS